MGLGSLGVFSSSPQLRRRCPEAPKANSGLSVYVTKKEIIPTCGIQRKIVQLNMPSIIRVDCHFGSEIYPNYV